MLLAGEKYVDPANYTTGGDPGDTGSALQGNGRTINRWTYQPPLRDARGVQQPTCFGSAHPAGLNFVFSDGSAMLENFQIDLNLYRSLGVRDDDHAVGRF